jgi:drug/metabolite transporter (DMT)-like permease
METKEKRPEQADLGRQAPRLDRNTRGPLGTLTLIAFLGYDLMYFVAFFNALLVAGVFVPPILIFAVFILLVAGVVATRWRWAPLLGAFVSLVTATFVLIQPHMTTQCASDLYPR